MRYAKVFPRKPRDLKTVPSVETRRHSTSSALCEYFLAVSNPMAKNAVAHASARYHFREWTNVASISQAGFSDRGFAICP